ncbi:uncharacterized protein [Nicotiana sylvestris]
MSNGVFPGSKISDVSKNPRYVDTHVDELFPVRKNSIRLNLISRKENVKESFSAEQSGSIKKSSVPSAFPAENQQQLKLALRGLATHEHQVASAKIAEYSELDGGSRSKIFFSELHVPCKMIPLDLTMKTNIRVVSASSINW